MPSIRIGFSTDFNLISEQVGIGTTLPTARLDVRGQIRSDNAAGGGGISTFTEYQGFLHSKQGIGNTVSIAQTTKGNLNSLSGEIVISGEVTVSEGTPIGGGRLDSLTVTSSFDLPRGGSANREVAPEKGSTRFNQDLGQLEFYTGYEWRTVGSIDGSGRGRGVFGGGLNNPVYLSTIDYVNIASTGNAISFGDLSATRRRVGGVSSETRGVFIRGTNSSNTRTNIMEYITIASGGNAINFGDGGVTGSTIGDGDGGCCSSSTRGIQAGGGQPANHNIITYITIHTLGNALDFGDLSAVRHNIASFSSPTRAIHYSGFIVSGSFSSAVDTHLISSTGNAVDFADPLIPRYNSNACSNSTRGIISAGQAEGGAPNATNISTLTTMNTSSTGSESVFGDLSVLRTGVSATSTQTRGVFAGGYAAPSPTGSNVIDYVQMQTTGNAIDFGDLTIPRASYNGISDSHGGLGGF